MGWLCKEVCVLTLGNKSLFMVIHQVVGTVCTELIGLPYHACHVNQLICIKICPIVHFKSQPLFYDCSRMVDLNSHILRFHLSKGLLGEVTLYKVFCSTSIIATAHLQQNLRKMSFLYLVMNTWLSNLNYIAKNSTFSILPKVNISEKQLQAQFIICRSLKYAQLKDGWRKEKEGEIIILNGESGPQFLET